MAKELTIRLLTFDIIKISQSWATVNNRSSFWRLYLNSDSTASVLCGQQEYNISSGHFHIIPAWTKFSCRNTDTTGHFYVHFDLMGIPGTLIRKYWPKPVKLQPKISYSKITQDIEIDRNGLSLQTQAQIKKLTYSALNELFKSTPPDKMVELQRDIQGHSHFTDLLEHIDSNLSQPLENSNLAHKCHMSQGHFIRSFTKAFNQSPAKYVQERRIARASELLSFTDMPIDNVSEECGFKNRFHFSRIFKDIIGLPPAAYKLQKTHQIS